MLGLIYGVPWGGICRLKTKPCTSYGPLDIYEHESLMSDSMLHFVLILHLQYPSETFNHDLAPLVYRITKDDCVWPYCVDSHQKLLYIFYVSGEFDPEIVRSFMYFLDSFVHSRRHNSINQSINLYLKSTFHI